jgi:hypothetical protein
LFGLLMFRKPKHSVLPRLYCLSHCKLSFCYYQEWLINKEEWSHCSNSACLSSRFFPTNQVFDKQIFARCGSVH